MPHKGLFTQCACILLESEVPLAEIESRLAHLKIVKRVEKSTVPWILGGPSLTVAFRPEVNGYLAVDIVGHKWPDHMGDPKKEPELFGAWMMGHFGPFAYPDALERAVEQSWSWEDAGGTVAKHAAFIRLRMSYVFGGNDDAPILPAGYNPVEELEFITDAVHRLLGLPSSLCYFNPNGEVLRTSEGFASLRELCRGVNQPPLLLWSNIRLFNIDSQWSLMDTVGLGQLDLIDAQACFSKKQDCDDVHRLLCDLTLYRLETKAVFRDGDTLDSSAGTRWRVRTVDESFTPPPRSVMRWLPKDGSKPPKELLH